MDNDEKQVLHQKTGVAEIIITPAPRAVAEDTDRVVGRLDFYYEQLGEDPMHIRDSFSAVGPHHSDGPYTRKLTVGPEWQKLDLGWVGADAGYVVIRNRRKQRTTKPTPEEAAEDAACGVLIRHEHHIPPTGQPAAGSAAWRVGPGRFFIAEAVDATRIFIRAENGPAKIVITVFPR